MDGIRLEEIFLFIQNYLRNHILYRKDLNSKQKYYALFGTFQHTPEFTELIKEFKFGEIREILEKIMNNELEKAGFETIKFDWGGGFENGEMSK